MASKVRSVSFHRIHFAKFQIADAYSVARVKIDSFGERF